MLASCPTCIRNMWILSEATKNNFPLIPLLQTAHINVIPLHSELDATRWIFNKCYLTLWTTVSKAEHSKPKKNYHYYTSLQNYLFTLARYPYHLKPMKLYKHHPMSNGEMLTSGISWGAKFYLSDVHTNAINVILDSRHLFCHVTNEN